MAYYYIRNNAAGVGSATGDGGRYASAQTGDWDIVLTATTQYYVSANAALAATTPPAAGDVLVFSNIHSHNYAVTTTISIPTGVVLTSVDDTAMDVELKGAVEQATGGTYDMNVYSATVGGRIFSRGMLYKAGDDIGLLGAVEVTHHLVNCSLIQQGSNASDSILMTADGGHVVLDDTDIQLANTTSNVRGVNITGGCVLTVLGGKLLFNTNKPAQIFYINGSGGGAVHLIGFDASNLGATGSLFDIDFSSDDNATCILHNVKYPSGASLNTSAIPKPGQRIESYGSGATNGYYNYEVADYYGDVVVDTGIYRDGSLTYDGTNRLSLKVSPIAANVIQGVVGLHFSLPDSKYLDLTSTITVRVFLLVNNTVSAAAALTDLDINVSIKHPDNTTQVLGTIINSSSASILKTGITLTTSSETWTGDDATNAKQYQIDVVIPALSNVTDGLVEANIEISADGLGANDQVYICPNWEAV